MISNLGLDYADEVSGDIIVSDLKAPRKKADDRRGGPDAADRPQRDRPQNRRNQSARY